MRVLQIQFNRKTKTKAFYQIAGLQARKTNKTKYRKISNRKWQDYVYIQCEYKSTKQKIKHLLREENKVKENKIS